MASRTHEDWCALVGAVPQNATTHPLVLERIGKAHVENEGFVRACFALDRVDLVLALKSSVSASPSAGYNNYSLHTWINSGNAAHLLRQSPHLMQALADNRLDHRNATLPGIVLAIDTLTRPDGSWAIGAHERLLLLSGEHCEEAPAVGSLLRTALMEYPDAWRRMTPAWAGQDDSPLRARAVEMGWDASMLCDMCRYALTKKVSPHLYANVRYPYGQQLLYSIASYCAMSHNWLHATPTRASSKPSLVLPASVNAHDAALVQALFDFTPLGDERTLELPPTGCGVIDPEHNERIRATVRTYLALDMLSELTLLFANNTDWLDVNEQAICLPPLSDGLGP